MESKKNLYERNKNIFIKEFKSIRYAAITPEKINGDKEYNDSNEPTGVLQPKASTIIMKVLYGARMARYDLLHACQALACKVKMDFDL